MGTSTGGRKLRRRDHSRSRKPTGLSFARMRLTTSLDSAIAARARVVQAAIRVRSFAALSRLLQTHALAPRLANPAVVVIAADHSWSRMPTGLSFARMWLTTSLDSAIAARARAVQAAIRVRSFAALSRSLKIHALAPRLASHAAVAFAVRLASHFGFHRITDAA